jgi:hypothetical protein
MQQGCVRGLFVLDRPSSPAGASILNVTALELSKKGLLPLMAPKIINQPFPKHQA